MTSDPPPATRRKWSVQALLLKLAYALLATWAAGIVVAAWQLDGWREDLSRTLLQLNADAQFRARAQTREAVDPEWYRRKALALLAATDRLRRDAAWTAFLPGSWHVFDPLEEQVQARLGREFDVIVVETVRRELYARASHLTGVPLAHGSGELRGGDCRSPVPANLERRLTAAAEDLPEFVAVTDYVANVERLDAAVQAFFSLQASGGGPEQLRGLVGYTLGKDLPGALEGAARMFRSREEVRIEPVLMQARLQSATRCSLAKAMAALHSRLLNTNDLFALEQGFIERSNGLFRPSARLAGFDRTLERYRAVHALLEDQNALLAKGRNDWMGQATLQLGSAYQQVLRRIAATRLLGPEAVEQLQSQSGAAFAEFRRQFEQAFESSGEPGIVWLADEKRFGLSPERAALRQGLGALLKVSFMTDATPPANARNAPAKKPPAKNAPESASLAKVLPAARALAAERADVVAHVVPLFPHDAQQGVLRVVDARVSELIYQQAFRSLKASWPAEGAPADLPTLKHQRDEVLALQAVLKQTGGAGFGERLVATFDGELLRRLGPLQEELERQPLESARSRDFAWWQGEALPLAETLGAAGPGPNSPPSFGSSAVRMNVLVQQAQPFLALASPALAQDPAGRRWIALKAELARYAARASDSSLLRLENYVAALGPDLRRDNCAERLAANAPTAAGDDQIAQRQRELHQALTQRCLELRMQATVSAGLSAP